MPTTHLAPTDLRPGDTIRLSCMGWCTVTAVPPVEDWEVLAGLDPADVALCATLELADAHGNPFGLFASDDDVYPTRRPTTRSLSGVS